MMILRWHPTETVETILDIDFEKLRSLGKKALLFDFDNTLAKKRSRVMPAVSSELLAGLAEEGFRIGILTNRRKQKPITGLSLPIIYNARKPWHVGYLAMLEMLSSSPKQAVMIGDRYITDVLGANHLGIHSIRVRSCDVEQQKKTRP